MNTINLCPEDKEITYVGAVKNNYQNIFSAVAQTGIFAAAQYAAMNKWKSLQNPLFSAQGLDELMNFRTGYAFASAAKVGGFLALLCLADALVMPVSKRLYHTNAPDEKKSQTPCYIVENGCITPSDKQTNLPEWRRVAQRVLIFSLGYLLLYAFVGSQPLILASIVMTLIPEIAYAVFKGVHTAATHQSAVPLTYADSVTKVSLKDPSCLWNLWSLLSPITFLFTRQEYTYTEFKPKEAEPNEYDEIEKTSTLSEPAAQEIPIFMRDISYAELLKKLPNHPKKEELKQKATEQLIERLANIQKLFPHLKNQDTNWLKSCDRTYLLTIAQSILDFAQIDQQNTEYLKALSRDEKLKLMSDIQNQVYVDNFGTAWHENLNTEQLDNLLIQISHRLQTALDPLGSVRSYLKNKTTFKLKALKQDTEFDETKVLELLKINPQTLRQSLGAVRALLIDPSAKHNPRLASIKQHTLAEIKAAASSVEDLFEATSNQNASWATNKNIAAMTMNDILNHVEFEEENRRALTIEAQQKAALQHIVDAIGLKGQFTDAKINNLPARERENLLFQVAQAIKKPPTEIGRNKAIRQLFVKSAIDDGEIDEHRILLSLRVNKKNLINNLVKVQQLLKINGLGVDLLDEKSIVALFQLNEKVKKQLETLCPPDELKNSDYKSLSKTMNELRKELTKAQTSDYVLANYRGAAVIASKKHVWKKVEKEPEPGMAHNLYNRLPDLPDLCPGFLNRRVNAYSLN